MPMNYLVSPVQQSGSPNVPITESTGGQLQGSLGNLGNIENSSFSGTVGSFPEIISNAVVCSGNLTTNNQLIVNTNFVSGTSTQGIVFTGASVLGSGNAGSIIANQSGAFAPAGYILVNVSTSGSPWVKVPFFNS